MFPSKLKTKLKDRIKTRFESSTPFGKRIQGKFQSASVNNLSSVLVKTKQFITQMDNDRRKLQISDESNYKPFRVTFLTDMIENAMKDNIFNHQNGYKPKAEFLMDHVLPEVQSFFSQLLKTIPYPLPKIEIPEEPCFGEVDSDVIDDYIDKGGVPNTDLVIFVQAEICGVEGAIAAASPCYLNDYDYRPVIGIIYFCLESEVLNESSLSLKTAVEVSVHEIGHIIGINSDLFPFYINKKTGKPYLENLERSFNPEWVFCADGMPRRVYKPSTDVMIESSVGSSRHFEIVTPTVATVTRNQFNCQELKGARLENQPTNTMDCFGSHWDERLFYTETMGAFYGDEQNSLSSITVAVLEDTGWFIGNYSLTTKSSFGHAAGCDFVNENCIVDGGELPSYSKGFFCNSPSSFQTGGLSLSCTPTHTDIGYCDLFDVFQNDFPISLLPPAKFQYFNDNSLSTIFFDRADYCPVSIPIPDEASCRMDDDGNTVENRICVNIEHRFYTAECVEFVCNEDLKKLQVKTFTSRFMLTCDFDFQVINHPFVPNAKIECPRLAVICPNMICPANCSGRGICDHSGDFPKCKCFDTNDQSPRCDGQNIQNPITLSPSTSPSSSPSKWHSSSPTMMLSDSPSVFVQISTQNPVVSSLDSTDTGPDLSDLTTSPSKMIEVDSTTTTGPSIVPTSADPTSAPIVQSKFIDTGIDSTSLGISLQSFYWMQLLLSMTLIIIA